MSAPAIVNRWQSLRRTVEREAHARAWATYFYSNAALARQAGQGARADKLQTIARRHNARAARLRAAALRGC